MNLAPTEFSPTISHLRSLRPACIEITEAEDSGLLFTRFYDRAGALQHTLITNSKTSDDVIDELLPSCRVPATSYSRLAEVWLYLDGLSEEEAREALRELGGIDF